MELIFAPIFFIFLLLRRLLRLLHLVIIIIYSLINFFTSSPNFFIFLLLLVIIIIIHSLINFFTSSHPELNDSSQSPKSLTIHKNEAPSTTRDSKRRKQGKTHPSHPEHELKLKKYKKPYICDGCKVHGVGKRYSCKHEQCNYDLHEDCMSTSTTTTTRHKFFRNSTFNFYEQPPRKCKKYCDACGKHVKGFVYHCPKTRKVLHPCCRNLEKKLEIDGVKFRLRDQTESECSWCKQTKIKGSKIKGWSYVSECGKTNIHVYCRMEMLVERWKDGTAIQGRHWNRNRGRGKKYLRIGLRICKISLRAMYRILLGDPITPAIGLLVDWLVEQ